MDQQKEKIKQTSKAPGKSLKKLAIFLIVAPLVCLVVLIIVYLFRNLFCCPAIGTEAWEARIDQGRTLMVISIAVILGILIVVPAGVILYKFSPITASPEKSRRKLAISLIVWPFVFLIGVIFLYAFADIIFAEIIKNIPTPRNMGLEAKADPIITLANTINLIFGAIGLVSVSVIISAVPIGIILLIKEKKLAKKL